MQLLDLLIALEQIAPLSAAEPWDNVGLLVGSATQSVSRVLLAIDYTPAVAAEAAQQKCEMVIAYHPPIFEPIKKITADRPTSLIYDAIRRNIAIFSPHTAWDAAPGGANDFLADILGLTDRRPLQLTQLKSSTCKLVTFVPASAIEKVSTALFAAGAGNIGNYSSCSFRIPGTGTFLGNDAASPKIGHKLQLESVEEFRLEMIVPTAKIDWVIKALRQSHPYEEPAFDLIPLAAPTAGIGAGRIGTLPAGIPIEQVIKKRNGDLHSALQQRTRLPQAAEVSPRLASSPAGARDSSEPGRS
jgi:dinuclear metal center YbgI/SA1388 family protein